MSGVFAGWVARHKQTSVVLAVVFVLWAAGSVTGQESSSDSSPSTSGTSQTRPTGGGGDRSGSGSESTGHRGSRTGRADQEQRHHPAGARGSHHQRGASATRNDSPAMGRTYVVTRIVDGDTLELDNGEIVRLAGIDTPEVGECGFEQASAALGRLVLGRAVHLAPSDEDRDQYGRLLRYVDLGQMDAGLRLIKLGLAIARYDSRDGYGYHPREDRYIAWDRAARNHSCPRPVPLAQPATSGCASGYSPCIPSYPPDLDCADVNGPIRVTGSDPHGLDADGDGVACE